jgi:uncharacterized damage-inducible protein DinB
MHTDSREALPSGNRQQALIETNIRCLRQALDLIDRIDDRAFTCAPGGMPRHRVGAHFRHILEFYDCFLNCTASAYIDYDSRGRDPMLERSRAAAIERIERIIGQLNDRQLPNDDFPLMVRMEDADDRDPWLPSSVSRELQALSSHTVHHFALISMTLLALGVEVDPSFGVAPSTLRHERKLQSSEAA